MEASSGHDIRCPVSRTLHSVDRVRLPKAPYRNATRSAMVASRVVPKADLHLASVCAA